MGKTLPIGSSEKIECQNKMFSRWAGTFKILNYLYLGTGKACAGHKSVKLSPKWPLKVREISVVGNLGKTLPIGSRVNQKKLKKSTGTQCWNKNISLNKYLVRGTG